MFRFTSQFVAGLVSSAKAMAFALWVNTGMPIWAILGVVMEVLNAIHEWNSYD